MSIKVLIVDDSALMRAMLTEIVGGAPDLEVVGAAPDPIAAREMIKSLNPDVLTLDVEMPKMDGLEFLGRLMRLRPMPVVMISSHTARGSEVTLQALETGAFDFVTKPQADNAAMLHAYTEEVRDKIRAAYHARGRIAVSRPAPVGAASGIGPVGSPGFSQRLLNSHVIAIGASTGGTEAIKDVLIRLPPEMPPIVVVQHMPGSFTSSFAKRLDGLASLTVVEARGGERLRPGTAYLAPGHSHLLVRKVSDGFVTELSSAEPVNRHRPAVDVLFDSVAAELGANATAIILTGMGKDGAKGMLGMRQAGAWTIGQDGASCVVYGMPREAALIGAVAEVAPLQDIAARLLARLRRLDHG
jgi:two-component system, chemotaxis family, protein-glutamate methylesterase/glutaminase